MPQLKYLYKWQKSEYYKETEAGAGRRGSRDYPPRTGSLRYIEAPRAYHESVFINI
jgi:hypothetical protein